MKLHRFMVVGCGRQGRVIAQHLLEQGHDVTGVDINNPEISELAFIACDVVGAPHELSSLIRATNPEVIICALPSNCADSAQLVLSQSGKVVVDVSFNIPDYSLLRRFCNQNGTLYIPDCGLAPGLPNFIIGDSLRTNPHKAISAEFYVGGISVDPEAYMGYVLSWDPSGLETEYTSPARYVEDGLELEIDPFNAVREVGWNEGSFEIFQTDGLRTLLELKHLIPRMTEWTVRRIGHVGKAEEIIKKGESLAEQLRENCSSGIDQVILKVCTLHEQSASSNLSMLVKGSKDISAMALTTGYTAATVGEILANTACKETGFITPERLAMKTTIWPELRKRLAEKGILFS